MTERIKSNLELKLANLLVDNTSCCGEEADKVLPMIFSLLNTHKREQQIRPENLRAMDRLTAKQALEIDDLKIKLEDARERIKDVIATINCIGAPLNDNIDHFNNQQLKIFFKIEQILSA